MTKSGDWAASPPGRDWQLSRCLTHLPPCAVLMIFGTLCAQPPARPWEHSRQKAKIER